MTRSQEAADILLRLDALAACTNEPGHITRLFLSPAHRRAIMLLRGWMEQAGLATSLDSSGTLVGVLTGGKPGAPHLLLGSHIDTVRNAGRYDGCLGVAVAIAAAARLRHDAAILPYILEVRAFGDEEGVRFPVTLTGARATAGNFDPAALAVQDSQGVTLHDALANFSLDPNDLLSGACTAAEAFAYLEVHIEQGPVLEAAGAPLGVVTAISGASRFEVTVTGHAGHAGTVPMAQRQDALAAAAEMVLAVRRVARAHDGVVATVGRLDVTPNAANVIPGGCVFSIDLRAPQNDLRARAEQAMLSALSQAARDNNVVIAAVKTHDAAAVACDVRLQARFEQAMNATGLPAVHLPSGAGHDAMAIASLCPVGMLFVRCAGGISHHPDEAVSEADVAAGLDVLTYVLKRLDPLELADMHEHGTRFKK